MSNRPIELLIDDILEAIEKVERYTKDLSHESLLIDDKTLDAVVRNLEIVGEAANRLPEDFKQSHSEVEWRKIIGLRHRIVHDYFNIDSEIIWKIIQDDIKVFKIALKNIRGNIC